MRTSILVASFCLLACSLSSAQIQSSSRPSRGDTIKDIYRVKEGSDLAKVLPYADRFQNPEFAEGVAYLRNGKTTRSRFNYSLVHGELMFIALSRDTMLFSSPEFIERITVGERTYYYVKEHGHVEIVEDFGKVRLGRKPFIVQMGSEKYASFEQYSSASAITSYSSFTKGNGEFNFLAGRDKIILKRRVTYFLMDRNRRFHYANRAGLNKVFPSGKTKIAVFMRDNAIDLEKEDDLRKTLEFCSTL